MATRSESRGHGTGHTLVPFIDGLARHGDRPAVLACRTDDIDCWSFAELADTVQRLADGIGAEDGLCRGDRAVLLGRASPQWLICALALIEAGTIPVPVDVQMSDENLQHVLSDSAAGWVFTQRDLTDRLTRTGEDGPRLWLLDTDDEDERDWRRLLPPDTDAANGCEKACEPDQEAVLFYTSGTTGRPKGVPLSHRNLAFQLDRINALDILRPDDRVMLPLPLHHVYPFVVGILAPLSIGASLVLPRSLTGPQVTRALRDPGATAIVGIPRLYGALLDAVQRQIQAGGRLAHWWLESSLVLSGWLVRHGKGQVGRRLLRPVHRRLGPDLRLLASGGAAMAPELQQRLDAFGWQVVGGYGLTETSPLLTVKLPGEGPPGCAGRPIPGIELRIAEDAADAGEDDEPRPQGLGEVEVRGPGIFSGYLKLPEKTAEVLGEDGWFRTGDLGRLDEHGFLHLAGRASTLIVTSGGENVQPQDIEAAYERHPLIQELGVLQRDGELVGLIVPDPEQAGDRSPEELETEIRAALEEAGRKLASYQRLSDFALTRSQLERTRLGKLRRHLLAERFDEAKQAPEQKQRPSPEESLSAEDRNLLEDPVAADAWSLLRDRFEDRHITLDSSLRLDLGVDSLDWLDLALAMRDATGVELDDEAIARIETVRDLLDELIQAEPAGSDVGSVFDHPESVLTGEDLERMRRPGPVSALLAATLFALDRWFFQVLFRLRVEGAERLPDGDTGFLLAPNHASYLDPLALAAAFDPARLRNTCWGGWTGAVFDTPLKRGLARLTRVLPIDPAKGARRNLAFAAAALQQHHNLVWFPEGERSADGRLQPFRPGIGLLLEHRPVPVVPVAIEGTHAALPVGRRWPRFTPITVRFGQVLDPGDLEREGDGDDTAERIATALHRHLESLLDPGGDGH